MSEPLTIRLGELGPDFHRRYPQQVSFQHQPAGMDFYHIRWNVPPYGVVKLDLKNHSITLHNVLSVQTAQELGPLSSEGLYEFTMNTGISESDLISHDEARLKTHAILHDLIRAGWTSVIERSEPRLRGKPRFDYTMSTDSTNGLDPAYLPTLDEWMSIESRTPWSFHAPGAYMEVSFTRERTLLDPQKPGAYMLTFSVKSEAENFRSYVGPEERSRWRTILPSVLKTLTEARKKKEDELKAKGIQIDMMYADPAIPAFELP